MSLIEKTMRLNVLCLALVCVAMGCGAERRPASVSILVAASTKEAVEEIARAFTRESGVAVEVMPGPSSGLAKQIEQGAPADLFLSADQPSVEHLAARNQIEDRVVLLGNRLVLAVPADSKLAVRDLKDLADPRIKRLALAVEKVPAGEYAREALRKAGVWEQVQDRVVGGADVRVTLQLVEQGADAGLVYLTDTIGNNRVRVALEVDPALHGPIEYPLALLRRPGGIKPEARRFYEHLRSAQAADVFRKAKFQLAP